jgi:hypothetical protein
MCQIGTTFLPYDGQPETTQLKTDEKVKMYHFFVFNEEDKGVDILCHRVV